MSTYTRISNTHTDLDTQTQTRYKVCLLRSSVKRNDEMTEVAIFRVNLKRLRSQEIGVGVRT